jgi:hypothetical protein
MFQAWLDEPWTQFSALEPLREKNWDLHQDAELAEVEIHLPQTGDTGDRAASSALASSGPQYVDIRDTAAALNDLQRWHFENAKCLYSRNAEVVQIQNSLENDRLMNNQYSYGVRISPGLQKHMALVNALQKERKELLNFYRTQCTHVWKRINEIIINAVQLHTTPQGLHYSSNTKQPQDEHPTVMAQTSETQSMQEQMVETILMSAQYHSLEVPTCSGRNKPVDCPVSAEWKPGLCLPYGKPPFQLQNKNRIIFSSTILA